LEALDSLEEFNTVFNLRHYYDIMTNNEVAVYPEYRGDDFISEAYQILKNDPEIIRMAMIGLVFIHEAKAYMKTVGLG
jgi:hypothetical protein